MTGTDILYKFHELSKQLCEVGTITTPSLLIRTWGTTENIWFTSPSGPGVEDWDFTSKHSHSLNTDLCDLYWCHIARGREPHILPSPLNPSLSLCLGSSVNVPWVSLWSFTPLSLSYRGKGRRARSRVLPGQHQSTHWTSPVLYLTYIMQRERCLVDSRTDQSVDPKFVNVVHHLVFDSREDEINLKRFWNTPCCLDGKTSSMQSLFSIADICPHRNDTNKTNNSIFFPIFWEQNHNNPTKRLILQ